MDEHDDNDIVLQAFLLSHILLPAFGILLSVVVPYLRERLMSVFITTPHTLKDDWKDDDDKAEEDGEEGEEDVEEST